MSAARLTVTAWTAYGRRSLLRHPISACWVFTCTAWLAVYLAHGGPAW